MRKLTVAVFAGLALLIHSAAGAAPLSGSFTIAGLGDVRVGPDFIDWGEQGNVFGPTNGDIIFVSGTGDFSGIALTTGEIEDLNAAQHPVGAPISEENFVVAAAQPAWDFTLEFIEPGAGTPAGCTGDAGDVCTPFLGSPFTIVNLAGGGSSVALALRGSLSDGSGDPASTFVASFTTQFAALTAADIIGLIASQGFVQSSHSAQFVVDVVPVSVPEPASMMLLGTGLLGLGLIGRRKKR